MTHHSFLSCKVLFDTLSFSYNYNDCSWCFEKTKIVTTWNVTTFKTFLRRLFSYITKLKCFQRKRHKQINLLTLSSNVML
jgi:hypothetical protein